MKKSIFKEMMKPFKYTTMSKFVYILYVILCALLFPTIQVCYSLVQKFITNAVEYKDSHYMVYAYMLCAIIFLVVTVINPLAKYLMETYVAKMVYHLSCRFEKHIINLPISYYKTHSSGEMISKFDNDMNAVYVMYTDYFEHFLLAIFSGMSSIALMFYMKWQLAVIILVLGYVETWSITKFSTAVRKNSNTIQQKYGKLNEHFIAMIEGIKVIRVFSLSNILLEKYAKDNTDICDESIKRSTSFLMMSGLSDIYAMFNLVGVLGVGIFMYLNGIIDLGTVMAFLVLQDGVSYMFSKIGSFFPNIQSSLACMDRVDSVFAAPTEEDRNSSHSVDSEKFNQVKIICEDVSFAYEGSSKVLDKISVAFEPGKITAITGPSGSGKTTLIKLILRLQAHQSGCIKMNHINYDVLSNFQIRNNISYVAQFPYIFNGTISDNIRCGNLEATDDEIVKAAKAGGAHEFIISREAGYKTILTDNGNNLSGGQRQRISLARAFLKNAPVLIMDEATTGVDSETEEFIYKKINEIAAKGVTVIMIAHRLSTINNADVKYVIGEALSKDSIA